MRKNKKIKTQKNNLTEIDLLLVLKQNKAILFAIFLISFLFYSFSLNFDFVSDDVYLIKNNPNLNSLSYVFASPVYFLSLIPHYLTYILFGLAPYAYRFLNILYHSGSAVLVFLIINKIFSKKIAVFSSLLFAIHPINIEAVAWISGYSSSMYTFLFLVSFLFFIYSKQLDKKYWISIVLLVFSLASSNKAVSVPIIFIFYEFLLNRNQYSLKRVIAPIALASIYTLVSILGIFPRLSVLQQSYYSGSEKPNPFLSFPISLFDYFGILVFPFNLSLYRTNYSINVMLLILRYIALFFIALFSFFLLRNKKYKELFLVCFYYVALMPLALPLGVGWITAERYIYLSSIAFFALFGIALNLVFKKYFYLVLSVLFIIYSGLFFYRIFDWKNEDTLWQKTVLTAPNYEISHNNMGDYYGRRGDDKKAIEEFLIAIKINPNYAPAYHNVGLAYMRLEDFDLAIKYLEEASRLSSNLFQSVEKLGEIYLYDKKDYTKSRDYFIKALEINPGLVNSRINLAYSYLYLGDKESALKTFELVLKFDPLNVYAQKGISEIKK
ncbi:tetratricopeptide repeat protein [Patescibacteria group bacterium]|nr:tetratricopeptide repeat protein [Patescibacteria group bacterium]